jgi:hypothetical protein
VAANSTSHDASGLTADTTYWFRVRAQNGTANSAWSNTASAKTNAPAPTAPAAPTNLTASAASSSTIKVSWKDNSSNETGFQLEQALDSGFSKKLTSVQVAANSTSHDASGLTADTTYWFRVRAQNGTANSAWSNTASATTTKANPPPPPPGGSVPNTVDQIIADTDPNVGHAAPPKGVPAGYPWAKGTNIHKIGPVPDRFTGVGTWGQVYEPVTGNPARNIRVQIADLQTYILSKKTGKWVQVQNQQVTGNYYSAGRFRGPSPPPANSHRTDGWYFSGSSSGRLQLSLLGQKRPGHNARRGCRRDLLDLQNAAHP